MNSKECKKEIVAYCQAHTGEISAEFTPPLTAEQVALTCDVDNWKRDNKYSIGGEIGNPLRIVRVFDCRPFDAQLRAYVTTDHWDAKILELIVQGE